MKQKLIVADDNTDAADTLALILTLSGHEVRVARGGREAIELAREFEPDVMLLDIGMPEVTGYDVARSIRAQVWARPIRLLALSGYGQAADKHRAVAAGFDHHLTKPVDFDALEKLLEPGA